jgi:hypothetical protein
MRGDDGWSLDQELRVETRYLGDDTTLTQLAIAWYLQKGERRLFDLFLIINSLQQTYIFLHESLDKAAGLRTICPRPAY